MSRLNLTLDSDTDARLEKHAKRDGKRVAALARELIRESLDRRERAEKRRKLALDYASDRPDAAILLREMEAAQYGYGGEEDN